MYYTLYKIQRNFNCKAGNSVSLRQRFLNFLAYGRLALSTCRPRSPSVPFRDVFKTKLQRYMNVTNLIPKLSTYPIYSQIC